MPGQRTQPYQLKDTAERSVEEREGRVLVTDLVGAAEIAGRLGLKQATTVHG